jgi:hypothetical protein
VDNNFYGNTSGICTLKACSSRIDKGSSTYPCGTDCVRKENTTSCSSACLDEYFYANDLGICKLKSCDGRIPKSTNNNPCGYNAGGNSGSCVLLEGNVNKCGVVCTNTAHYYADSASKYICVEKSCSNRNVNGSSSKPCGSGACYQLEDKTMCDVTCSNPRFLFYFFFFYYLFYFLFLFFFLFHLFTILLFI